LDILCKCFEPILAPTFSLSGHRCMGTSITTLIDYFSWKLFHVLCLGDFLTVIFLSYCVVECGRPSVAEVSTHLLPFCKRQSRPLLQASERVGITEEYTWGVPRKLQWNACFYEPSLIRGCHAACLSGISIKGASSS